VSVWLILDLTGSNYVGYALIYVYKIFFGMVEIDASAFSEYVM